MNHVTEIFGSMVFDDATMKEKLPRDVYKALKKTIEIGKSLDPGVANTVANAMKDWAVSKGADHWAHWFHPLTELTAEKHTAFLMADENGNPLPQDAEQDQVPMDDAIETASEPAADVEDVDVIETADTESK